MKEKVIASASHPVRRSLQTTDGPHHQIVLAAPHTSKYRAEALGLPNPCARTTLRTSDAGTGHPRSHTFLLSMVLRGYFHLARTLMFLRSSMTGQSRHFYEALQAARRLVSESFQEYRDWILLVMTSGKCRWILRSLLASGYKLPYSALLVRQRIHALRQSTEFFSELHTFST